MTESLWRDLINSVGMAAAAFPWSTLITAASTLAAVWITSELTARRTMRERRWDIQREAYGEILGGMSEAEHHCADMLFVLDTLKFADSQPVTGSTPQLAVPLDRFGDAISGVRRRLARDRLILPVDFVGIFQEFAAESRKLDMDTSVTAFRIGKMKNLISSYRDKLEGAARRDLNGEG